MDRRSFFKSMVGGVVTTAAVRTWPFRVFSFPSEPKLAMSLGEFRERYLLPCFNVSREEFERDFPIGSTVHVRIPQRFLQVDRELITITSLRPLTAERGISH